MEVSGLLNLLEKLGRELGLLNIKGMGMGLGGGTVGLQSPATFLFPTHFCKLESMYGKEPTAGSSDYHHLSLKGALHISS
jgi:hypothetical protein